MKVQVNELRIGNLCLRKNTNNELVTCIINITYFNLINEFPEDYKPIPLTEERLLKFGLLKTKQNTFLLGCYELIKYEDSYRVTLPKNGILATIKYVHQLQNLYFCLTGEELQVKELESDKGYKPEDTISVDLNFTITDIESCTSKIKASELNDDYLKEGRITLQQYLKNKDVIGL